MRVCAADVVWSAVVAARVCRAVPCTHGRGPGACGRGAVACGHPGRCAVKRLEPEHVDAFRDLYLDHSWECPGSYPQMTWEQTEEMLSFTVPWVLEEFARKRAPVSRPAKTKIPKSKPAKVDMGNESRTRRLVKQRSEGVCERCGDRNADTMHHRRLRSQRGPWTPSNILHLCGDGTRLCHGELTNTNGRRAEYERAGWIVPSGQDWLAMPVRRRGQWVLLDDDGGFEPLQKRAGRSGVDEERTA